MPRVALTPENKARAGAFSLGAYRAPGWGELPDSEPDQRQCVDFILSKPLERETLYREVAQAPLRQRRV
jgi:hypothetical protein